MKNHNEFSPRQEQQSETRQETSAQTTKEFADTNEVLRFDASKTTVPPAIARKLQASLGTFKAESPWWKQIFTRLFS